jgi:hypothetical protein
MDALSPTSIVPPSRRTTIVLLPMALPPTRIS